MSAAASTRWQRLSVLFDHVVTLDAPERVAFIAGLNGDDAALSEELQALIAADCASGVLDRRVQDLATGISDTAGALIGQTCGRWRIVEILGRGGMGAVYRAERADGAYQQQAALKLIRLGVDSPQVRERFLRERQILARLQHPHIAALLDGGLAENGQPYFAMELIDGEAIDRWCDRHRLTIAERLRLFLQVLDAVQHAHAGLVVHRDLKPSNILVTEQGQAKLLDFGIAKLLEDESGTTRDRPFTPEYAAPEQLRGEPITVATDIYALGVVLYQLLSGVHPFGLTAATPIQQQIQALDRTCTPITRAVARAAPDVAVARSSSQAALSRALRGDLAAIVETCLAGEPARRYASSEAFSADLRRHLGGQPISIRAGSRRYRAGKFARRHRSILVTLAIVLLALAVGVGVGLQQAREVPGNNRSLAVLPFVDLSTNKDQEYFSDGISEELLATLAKVDGLRVAARTSSFSFKNALVDVRQIGRALNVGSVLEGSVRRDGKHLRVTAELIDVASGFDLWSENYERDVDDLLAVQDQITHAIIGALKIKLAIAMPQRKTVDPEAYDLYLQGVFFSNKSSEEGLRKSLDFFQRSLEKDVHNAKAWSGIAKVWLWLADAYVKPLDAYPQMRIAAQRALTIDDTDADAHVYTAEAKRVIDYDPAGAEAELRRALKLDPNSSMAHLFFGMLRGVQGYRGEGLKQVDEALKLDPLSPIISNFAAMQYIASGRYDDAIAEVRRLEQLDKGFMYLSPFLADAYREQGKYDAAIVIYQQAEQATGEPQPGLAITYARQGHAAEAKKILAEMELAASKRYVPADQIAAIYAALGENDAAFRWLQRAYDEHSAPLYGISRAREFRTLHSDPRFAPLLLKLGLDPQRILAADAAGG